MKLIFAVMLVAVITTSYCHADEGSAFEHHHDHDHGHSQGHAHGQHHVHSTHSHGVATMKLVGENEVLFMELTIPMVNIVGFEHSPETDKEKQLYNQKMVTINNPHSWLKINERAECEFVKHNIIVDSKNEHADVVVDMKLNCNHLHQLDSINVLLFDKLEGLEQIKAEWVTSGQQGVSVTGSNNEPLKIKN